MVAALRASRPRYASYLVHLGFTCLVVGIAGSSLGSVRQQVLMQEGETIAWCDYTVRLAKTREFAETDKLIADVQLDVARRGQHVCTLFPARHFHRHQDTWTTEVAMHSTWSRDLYTILHGAAGVRQAELTLVINPLVRWIWLGGWLFLVGGVVRLWPTRTGGRASAADRPAEVPGAGTYSVPTCEGLMADCSTAIQVSGLWKRLGGRTILRDVNMSLQLGEMVALVGANGAGKTTLLKCLAVAAASLRGRICWLGREQIRSVELRRVLGYAGHDTFLYPQLTAEENLLFAARMCGVPDPARRVREQLESAELAPLRRVLVAQLSPGMRRRLSLLRAVIHDPLDRAARRTVRGTRCKRHSLVDQPTAGNAAHTSLCLLCHA